MACGTSKTSKNKDLLMKIIITTIVMLSTAEIMAR